MLVTVVLMAVLLTYPSFAEELDGGWVGTESINIPEEVQSAFAQVTSGITDISYESVGLLSTQIVAGTNYCLLCRTRVPGSEQAPRYCLMYIYVDLNGEASLLKVEDIVFNADDDTDAADEDSDTAEQQETSSAATDDTAPTMGEKNALNSAIQYLDYTAFSYSGLIDQLEYEGFSTEEATYGVDHCGADWNEQAAKSAEAYLEYTSFSRSGLIDQLMYEGFTQEQAEYGVTAVGY